MHAALLLFALGATGCKREQAIDTFDPVDDDACETDSDCLGWEVCDDEASCVVGDHSDDFESASQVFQVADLDGEPSAGGYIQHDGDVDYFRYESVGGEWIEIRSRGVDDDAELDTVVAVRNSGGALHAYIDDYATGSIIGWDSVLQVFLPAAGSWYVTVEDRSSFYDLDELNSGSTDFEYELFVRTYSFATSETDSITAPSREIVMTGGNLIYSVGVELETPGDSDWIAVTLPHGDAPLEIYGQPDIPGSPAVSRIKAYDPNDAQVLQMDDIGVLGPVEYPHGQQVTYMVEATSANGGGGSDHWYTLYFVARGSGEGWDREFEPNDAIGAVQALPLEPLTTSSGAAYDRAWVQGTLDPTDDEDWFSFTSSTDRFISVRCLTDDIGSLADLELELYGPGDVLLQSFSDQTGQDPSYDLLNEPVNANQGVYKLRIMSDATTPSYGPGAYYRCAVFITPFEAV